MQPKMIEKIANAFLTSGKCSSGVRNNEKCTSSEGIRLSSITSAFRPKKMRMRIPRTQFFYLGVKRGPLKVSLFSIGR